MNNDRCGTKQSLHPVYRLELQFSGRTSSFFFNIWVGLNLFENENYVKYWMAIEKIIQSGFHEPLKFSICLNIPTKSGVCIKWFVIVNRYIDQVIPWRCLSSILHCTYTLGGKHRSIQYCSSLLHYRRLSCDVVSCKTQEVEI